MYVKYNNVVLSDFVKIAEYENTLLPNRINRSVDVPMMHGEHYTGFKYGKREIKFKFDLRCRKEEFEHWKNTLSTTLNVLSPQRLYIDNRMYYAVPDGDTDFSTVIEGWAECEVKFICYDPFGYSENYKAYKCSSPITNITNNGNAETYPIISVNFMSEACMFQVTDSEGRTILIGKQKDVTLPSKPNKLLLIDDYCDNASNFFIAGNVLDSSNKLTDGTFAVSNNGLSIVCNNYGTAKEKFWNGTAFRRNIGTNLEEFEVACNFSFSSDGKTIELPNNGDLALCISKSGAIIKSEPNDPYTHGWVMAYYEVCELFEVFQNGHAKIKYGSITGWIETKYIYRIVKNTKSLNTRTDLAENQMGCIECHGFDSTGARMFKMQMLDTNEFFEFAHPYVEIGGKEYLYDAQGTPIPNQVRPKDDNGNYLPNTDIESGSFGRWNDYIGTFKMRRRKLENGKYRWWASVNRTADGINITQTIDMGPGVVNDNLPQGELNHLVFYIGRYSTYPEMTCVALNHLKVSNVALENGDIEEESFNPQIFNPGDRLEINCETGEVTLNGENALEYLDIGSIFMPLSAGDNQLAIITDDSKASVTCGFRERYL
ncbi:MAG: distal tail protein Dit [Paraclostridium sp.]